MDPIFSKMPGGEKTAESFVANPYSDLVPPEGKSSMLQS